MSFSPSSGWAGSQRVPTTDGRDELHDDLELESRVSGFDWPSEDAPAVWVELATEEEAVEVSSFAREQLMGWLAGGGLHPVAVSYRWVIACCFLRIERDAGLIRKMMGIHGRGLGLGEWEEHVMKAIKPSAPWKETLQRVDANLGRSSHQGKYAVHEDERAIAEVLDWVAEEGIERPAGFSDEDVEGLENDAREIGRASMRLLCRWLASSGPDLLSVLQRFYAMAFERYRFLTGKMSGEDLAGLLLQVRATFSEEMKRFFSEPGEVLLGYTPKNVMQKSAASSEVYARNAAENCPRQQLGGDAGLDRDERGAVDEEEDREESAAEEEARAISADWLKAGRWLSFIGTVAERDKALGQLTPRQREFLQVLEERESKAFVQQVQRRVG